QAGILAAAGILALDEMVERLAEDHARAARLAEGLAAFDALSVPAPHTNIVRFELKQDAGLTGEQLLSGLEAAGVKVGMGGPWGFRAVTHYWIDDAALDQVLAAFNTVLKG